jgi:hypothetical protein
MHPVARVSIKYWNTSVRNKFFGARLKFVAYGGVPIFNYEYTSIYIHSSVYEEGQALRKP